MSLNKELQDAIQKNLPAMVGTELNEYLSKAEEWKRQVEDQGKLIASLQKQHTIDEERNWKLDTALREHKALNIREKEITDRENNIKVILAEFRAGEAEKRAEVIHSLVGTVFKNSIVKRTLHEGKNFGQNYGNDGKITQYVSGSSATETIEEE